MLLMDVPRAAPRLKSFGLKFTAAEKTSEATAVFKVRCSVAFLCCVHISTAIVPFDNAFYQCIALLPAFFAHDS